MNEESSVKKQDIDVSQKANPLESPKNFSNTVRPQREQFPSTPEKISEMEKLLTNLASELANITDMKEAIEHAFSSKSTEDANFQSAVITYFNSLKKSFDEFDGKINHEIDYSRELEERIKNADLSKQVLILDKELQTERAKITLCVEEVSKLVREKMMLVEDKCTELKSADALIQESIYKFRTDTFAQTENEYKALKINCENLLREFTENAQRTLEAVKKQSIDFLGQCEKDNKTLIKKVPFVKNRFSIENWITVVLGALGILSFLGQMLAR